MIKSESGKVLFGESAEQLFADTVFILDAFTRDDKLREIAMAAFATSRELVEMRCKKNITAQDVTDYINEKIIKYQKSRNGKEIIYQE